MVTGTDMRSAKSAAAGVVDPEIRVITIDELGILRDVAEEADGTVIVTITPTYSGCPAMDVIRADIAAAVQAAGHPDVVIRTVYQPAWSTDMISDAGRAKLRTAGIAPPGMAGVGAAPAGALRLPLLLETPMHQPACPQCGAADTEEISRFGSTACKSLWRCRACAEPFDHIKAF